MFRQNPHYPLKSLVHNADLSDKALSLKETIQLFNSLFENKLYRKINEIIDTNRLLKNWFIGNTEPAASDEELIDGFKKIVVCGFDKFIKEILKESYRLRMLLAKQADDFLDQELEAAVYINFPNKRKVIINELKKTKKKLQVIITKDGKLIINRNADSSQSDKNADSSQRKEIIALFKELVDFNNILYANDKSSYYKKGKLLQLWKPSSGVFEFYLGIIAIIPIEHIFNILCDLIKINASKIAIDIWNAYPDLRNYCNNLPAEDLIKFFNLIIHGCHGILQSYWLRNTALQDVISKLDDQETYELLVSVVSGKINNKAFYETFLALLSPALIKVVYDDLKDENYNVKPLKDYLNQLENDGGNEESQPIKKKPRVLADAHVADNDVHEALKEVDIDQVEKIVDLPPHINEQVVSAGIGDPLLSGNSSGLFYYTPASPVQSTTSSEYEQFVQSVFGM